MNLHKRGFLIYTIIKNKEIGSLKNSLFFFIPEKKTEIQFFLENITQNSREKIIAHPQTKISLKKRLKLFSYLLQSLKKIPKEYVVKEKKWGGLLLYVDKNVLIPRMETEEMMYLIKSDIEKLKIKSVLDIGIGSGCVSLFIKKNFPNIQVQGIDVSPKAVRIAHKNAKKNKQDVSFYQKDFKNIFIKVDCVIANLPYVPSKTNISKCVKREPKNAIFSGSKGLSHYKELGRKIERKEIEASVFWIESLSIQKKEIEKIFNPLGIVKMYTSIDGGVLFTRIKI